MLFGSITTGYTVEEKQDGISPLCNHGGNLIAECMNETVKFAIIHKVSAPNFHFEPNKMSYHHLWHSYTWCD